MLSLSTCFLALFSTHLVHLVTTSSVCRLLVCPVDQNEDSMHINDELDELYIELIRKMRSTTEAVGRIFWFFDKLDDGEVFNIPEFLEFSKDMKPSLSSISSTIALVNEFLTNHTYTENGLQRLLVTIDELLGPFQVQSRIELLKIQHINFPDFGEKWSRLADMRHSFSRYAMFIHIDWLVQAEFHKTCQGTAADDLMTSLRNTVEAGEKNNTFVQDAIAGLKHKRRDYNKMARAILFDASRIDILSAICEGVETAGGTQKQLTSGYKFRNALIEEIAQKLIIGEQLLISSFQDQLQQDINELPQTAASSATSLAEKLHNILSEKYYWFHWAITCYQAANDDSSYTYVTGSNIKQFTFGKWKVIAQWVSTDMLCTAVLLEDQLKQISSSLITRFHQERIPYGAHSQQVFDAFSHEVKKYPVVALMSTSVIKPLKINTEEYQYGYDSSEGVFFSMFFITLDGGKDDKWKTVIVAAPTCPEE